MSLFDCLDTLEVAFSRLHYYSSKRIPKPSKRPAEYLLKCGAKDVRKFLSKLSKYLRNFSCHSNPAGSLNSSDYGFLQLSRWTSDLACLIRKIRSDCNLKNFSDNIFQSLDLLYQQLFSLLPGGYLQLELFNSQDTFHEEIKESKLIHKILIDFEWVPVLAFVGKFLRTISEKVLDFPASLVCPKSSWCSTVSFTQLFI